MARLTIVRHGNTFEAGEPPRRVGARTDLALTAAGRGQALVLKAHFTACGWSFDRVVTSPLRRAADTAALIAGRAEHLDWLTEIDHGPDEDRPEPEVAARIGAHLPAWDADGVLPPGWRVDRDAVAAGWRTLLAQAATRDVLAVTSNGIARFVLPPWTDLADAPANRKLRTGAYAAIEDGRLVAWDIRPDTAPPAIVPPAIVPPAIVPL